MPEVSEYISIARDFSAYPAGRDDRDGPKNGARFRDDILLPRLRRAIEGGKTLTVSLKDVRSFGSSFLEEAFGGLVRKGLTKADIRKHLVVETTVEGTARYVAAIHRYIQLAKG